MHMLPIILNPHLMTVIYLAAHQFVLHLPIAEKQNKEIQAAI